MRFNDNIAILSGVIADKYCIKRNRAKKLIGNAFSDVRIMETILEHVGRQITGRGDGLTLVDLAENAEIKRLEESQAKSKSRKKKTA